MALVVNTNVPSIASQRYLMESRKEMETAMERLSSGKRINSAADDAAGLAISNRMTTQIQGLNVAIRNANDGMSVVQTAEGAMSEVTDMLQRMRDLALQAVHGVNNDADRATLDAEVQALKAEIDRVSETTTFNNQALLDGTYNVLLQIGKDASETMALDIASVATAALGLVSQASESNDPVQTLVGNRVSLASFAAGDIEIDSVGLRAFNSTSQDISDLVTNINTDVETVTASAFNTVVAKNAGTGVVAANTFAIAVGGIGAVGDADYQAAKEVHVAASANMDELIANINAAFFDGEVVASQTTDGKLVLSNSTGASISVAEAASTGQGTSGAYDGGSGFLVTGSSTVAAGTAAYASSQVFNGFLKLASNDDSPITIDIGNKALTSPGLVSDLTGIGFQRILEDPEGNYNQVVGSMFTANSFTSTSALGRSDTTGQADLTINGVEIYDSTLTSATNTFQGKLDLVNAFSDETGVVASAYFEKSFDTTNTTFISNQTFRINGVQISYGSSASVMVTNINNSTDEHGLTATLNGKNIVLSGDNVQNVNILAEDYSLSDDSGTVQAAARRTSDTAPTAQTLTVGDTSAKEGRVFKLTIYNTGAGSTGGSTTALAATTLNVLYTAQSGASGNTVAEGLRNKLYSAIQAGGLADTGVYSVYATASSGTITFNSALNVGDRKIELSVVNLTAANEALGGTNTLYGGMKLSSIDGNPMSIELGERIGATTAGLAHGFKELNVGDSTFDSNDPTFEMTSTPASTSVSGLSIATSDSAENAITVLDDALESVIQMRADLGAVENRLDHTVSNLSNVVENTSAARSRIEDADFAVEAAALARAQILQQAGTAMLAQANAAPQNVLSLLG